MTAEWISAVDLTGVTHLLCDADGTLFGSEEPAYAASADVTNKLLAELGADRTYDAAELQRMTNGQNFRGAAMHLASRLDRPLARAALDDWVTEEMNVVTAHLRTVLRPDRSVTEAVTQLGQRFALVAVTSSAGPRLDACLDVTGLSPLFPPERRFSAETSLVEPVSKPDPAVYLHAAERLGIKPNQGLAIEDSVNGATSAVAAGHPTVGILQFVPSEQRSQRTAALTEAGVAAVVDDWSELVTLLSPPPAFA
jgi:beta-phosphoglucomutase-like phosphatase (HAD superfamily)